MDTAVSSLETTAKTTGLSFIPLKTRTMRVDSGREEKIQIRGVQVENLDTFTYLGSIVSTTGATDKDMLKPVWRSRH